VDGRVRLAIGKEAEITYMVARPGEVFGWSSMVDREAYTANAQCAAPTTLLKVAKQELNKIFEKDPRSGMMFFKRLAGTVVQRLIYNYEAFMAEGSLKAVSSYGTGQVTPTGED